MGVKSKNVLFPVVAESDVKAQSGLAPMVAEPATPLHGSVQVPGDKSISHRALLLGASACGETQIEGLLEAEDVLATAAALRALGAQVERADGVWRMFGRGVGGFVEARRVLDMGNSGTAARLLMGLVASQPILSFFSGDLSLCRRPMRRVIEPLTLIGARRVGARRRPAAAGNSRRNENHGPSSTCSQWPRRR